MAHAHQHAEPGGLGQLDERRADSRRRMLAALAINAVLLVGTFVGALLTGSLALLADTGHVLSDVAAIILGLVAGGLASLPGGPRRTFGYQRTEVFAALANGIALAVIAILVSIEAVERLGEPPDRGAGGAAARDRGNRRALPPPGSSPAVGARTSTSRACFDLGGRRSGSFGVVVSGGVIWRRAGRRSTRSRASRSRG